jgi:hypothetical protein
VASEAVVHYTQFLTKKFNRMDRIGFRRQDNNYKLMKVLVFGSKSPSILGIFQKIGL